MARRKKTGSNLPAVPSGRLVKPLTKAQSKLLDALIDDPRLSPADLCETAGVPAYTWRRALRSPAFAAALMEAQRSALDASRLSRTQAAIEKAQTSPAFARLCFQIDGSIKEAPTLVQQFTQNNLNMPISQLRKSFEAGNVIEIPDLNYTTKSEVAQLAVIPSPQKKEDREAVIFQPQKCPTNDDHQPGNGLAPAPKCSEVGSTKSEVVEAQHYEVRSGTKSEAATDSEVRGRGAGQAFRVIRVGPEGSATATRYEVDDYDLL